MIKAKTGIIITGASSGIGKAAAKEFARTGFKIFTIARRINELNRINDELEKEKISVETFPCNVASATNVEQVIKKIVAENRIGCLINNAGITSFKPALDNSVKDITDIISTNLLGSIYNIKYLLPHFIKNEGGTIINIISTAARKLFTESSAYTASKMGLLGYTDVLREEVRKHNIRVINVLPGATDTSMWSVEDRKEHSHRMMTADDVARTLVWLFLQQGNLVTEEITIRPIAGDI
ncbi:MAG: SDR family oxidoreductase [Bacteroidota bacterium]|nr:SDR family oxidoreductase [Bacteroidota bacterium]